MKRRYSLRGLVLTAAMALILLPLLALGGGLVGIAAMNWSTISLASHETDEAQQQISRLITDQWNEVGSPEFLAQLARLEDRWDFAIEVRSLENRVRYASPWVQNGGFHPPGLTVQPTQRVALLQRNGTTVGLLNLWIWPKAALSGLSRAAQVGLWAALGTLVAVLFLVLWWIGRAILRPLKALQDATAAVADGRLDFVIPDSGVTELDALGRAFAQMRDQLQEALDRQQALQDERRQLIAAIGHDLRTPISSVRAFAEGLRDGLAKEPAKAVHYGEVILNKTIEVERLVEELFQFSRLELPEVQVNRQPVEVAAFLTGVLDAFQPHAQEKGVTLHADGPALQASLDADLLGRAINNLVANALRHTPAGGRVWLSWGPSLGGNEAGGGLQVIVSDTGEGIPPEQLPLLFTPLHRIDGSRSRRSGGTGLGLAITARVVALHGGTISCESQVSRGSRFIITLPEV